MDEQVISEYIKHHQPLGLFGEYMQSDPRHIPMFSMNTATGLGGGDCWRLPTYLNKWQIQCLPFPTSSGQQTLQELKLSLELCVSLS